MNDSPATARHPGGSASTLLIRGTGLLVTLIVAACAAAAFVPIRFDTREELFEIPAGTWARRQAGANVEILPSEIHLMTGIRDVLVLRNLDEVPQIFGPTLIMPGQSFRLPFDMAAEYNFACSAHLSGQMLVSVIQPPDTALGRLRWRTGQLIRHLKQH